MLTKKNDSFNRNILLEMQIMLNAQSANLVHGCFFMLNIRFAHQLEYILTYILIEKLSPK